MARCHRSLAEPHDPDLSLLLKVYIVTGLAFMLLPGTLVGVLNLLKISASHMPKAADAGWIQAHGHAQIFGWLGTFILGIGYYAIPRLRLSPFSNAAAWATYVTWTAGVTMRWAVGTWPWNWRLLFPLAGALELTAVAFFAVSVFLLRPRGTQETWRTSVRMITVAGVMMFAAVAVNTYESFVVAIEGDAPVFAPEFNNRFLVLITWGFVVPFIWGFTSRWVPALLGLRDTIKPLAFAAVAAVVIGVAMAMAGHLALSAAILLAAALAYIASMRLFERAAKEPRLRGVHPSATLFLRLTYVWLIAAAAIAIVAAIKPLPNGYAGASRHALTVGFFAAAVFAIGPRVLPAFFNVQRLWSQQVMAASLLLLNVGCATRVVSQILAYEHISALAWKTLPLSAIIEMTAVLLFAFNMLMTLTTGSPLQGYMKRMETAAPGTLPRT